MEERTCQGDVASTFDAHLFRMLWHFGVAQREPSVVQLLHELEVGEVELDLSVEVPDDGVDEVAMSHVARFQARKDLRVEPGHLLQDLRLHMVRIPKVPVLGQEVFDRPLPELGEGLLDLLAVVGLCLVGADSYSCAPNEHRVLDAR